MTWAPGRVAWVGTIACNSASPSASVNDHASSIMLRSDCLPCRLSTVGGCGRNSLPVRKAMRVLPAPRLDSQSLDSGDGMPPWAASASSTISRNLSRASVPVWAVYQTRRRGMVQRWTAVARFIAVLPAWRCTVMITSG
ncbi:hypothetical protein SAMN04488548_1341662 [Gordonia westfalica]|uniref:Uncharacterized protein n=1 Tax=Gordonia westfalica TaxID=158898 RepID=A0A1H2J335_9ACTN|nr:hypothetical protein SAMN04488548_1341662 [Gordonia westfalica]